MSQELPIVYIGKRNTSFYINVCIKLFERGEEKIVVEALGMNICKAVDVCNLLVNVFKKGEVTIENITTDMVMGQTVRGLPKKVSRIRILLSRAETSN